MPQKYYVLKVKGKAKIPDYLQIRDQNFTLIGYFRPQQGNNQSLKNDPNRELYMKIEELSADLPFGILTELFV